MEEIPPGVGSNPKFLVVKTAFLDVREKNQKKYFFPCKLIEFLNTKIAVVI